MINHVKQEEPSGCGVACMAMVLGKTYQEVKEAWGRDFVERGTHSFAIREYVSEHGFSYIHKGGVNWRSESIGGNKWAPFAPIHIAQVKQPSGNAHFVVVLKSGDVMDPISPEPRKLSDWIEVYEMIGFYPIQTSENQAS